MLIILKKITKEIFLLYIQIKELYLRESNYDFKNVIKDQNIFEISLYANYTDHIFVDITNSFLISAINKFVELNPKLSKDKRNILSVEYKNILSDKRASWQLLNSMEKKETKKKSAQVPHVKEIKTHIEDEKNKNKMEQDLIKSGDKNKNNKKIIFSTF